MGHEKSVLKYLYTHTHTHTQVQTKVLVFSRCSQCARILHDFPDVAHFSAGDLLRAHVQSGTPEGNEVAEMIKQGML